MSAEKMHADEVDTDVALVRGLLAAQFPHWADRPIEPVLPRGTDNALYRIGRDLVARLPRREKNVVPLEKELRWLSELAPRLPLAIPIPRALGEPGGGYPFRWSVYGWLPGRAATDAQIADLHQAAMDLAGFIAALHRIDPAGGPPPGEHNFFRGEPLRARDEAVRAALASLGATVDAGAVMASWDAALAAPEWDYPPVWIHGDLDARNLLLEDGRLTAVVDFGCLGVGDPACDVMVAWKLLFSDVREAFRIALAVDEATWGRARGWALSQALMALAYYTVDTNAVLVHEAQRWLVEVLADVV